MPFFDVNITAAEKREKTLFTSYLIKIKVNQIPCHSLSICECCEGKASTVEGFRAVLLSSRVLPALLKTRYACVLVVHALS